MDRALHRLDSCRRINPAYIDPTSGGKSFYTANLLRPYVGYSAIDYSCSCGERQLQFPAAQVNRRFGKRLQFGANWTWSKTMSYATGAVDSRLPAICPGQRLPAASGQCELLLPDSRRQPPLEKQIHQGGARWLAFQRRHQAHGREPADGRARPRARPLDIGPVLPPADTVPFRCEMATPNPFLAAGAARPKTAPTGNQHERTKRCTRT